MKTYVSTRKKQEPVNFYQAVIQGMANDGGLFVPNFELETIDIQSLLDKNYVDIATEIMTSFIDEQDKEDIRDLCQKAYTHLFSKDVVPVVKVGQQYIAELFQGPTAAFKDMALSLLPYFMTYSLKKLGKDQEVLILAATSGDTGKAALEGFKDVDSTSIKVFYPVDGVSCIQKQQMITQSGKNVEVIGIQGNFDDAQRAVKEAFVSEELKNVCQQHNIFLSSANSINIGRLIPQIVYYFYAYITLVNQKEIELGEEVNFTIPSGNFGNCLAGYLAKEMGLPVHKFIIASNKNHILSDFFQTGIYDANREFYKTNAPAMDILVSSNLERLIYMLSSHKEDVNQYMNTFNKTGVYEVDEDMKDLLHQYFYAHYQNEQDVLDNIEECYNKYHYLLDTHTAVGYGVYKQYVDKTKDSTKNILLSTASPYKFPQSVYQALTQIQIDDYDAIEQLNQITGVPVPKPLQNMKNREVLHHQVINKDEIVSYILKKVEEF